MTKDQLEQLKFLKKEIELIEDQISSIKHDIVSDTVKGSQPHFPYIYHSIPIEGVDINNYTNRAARLRRELAERKVNLINTVCSINEYINSLEDSEIRQIIILKYINGLTWSGVAAYLGYADESVPRKRIDRYLIKD